MCLIGFCKITAKLDSYMASLGVNLGRIGGGLSGMGALLMAGRLLHMGGSGGRIGGGSRKRELPPWDSAQENQFQWEVVLRTLE